MEITTLQEYMEHILGVKNIEEISKKQWYEISMNAKDGFKFEIDLLEMRDKASALPVVESAKVVEQPAITKPKIVAPATVVQESQIPTESEQILID